VNNIKKLFWLLRRSWILIVITIFLFIALLWFPETRYHVLVESWGVFTAGVVVYLILESNSEDFKNEIWLHNNIQYLQAIIGSLSLMTGNIVCQLLGGLYNELIHELTSGKTREARKHAANQLFDILKDVSEEKNEESKRIIDTFNLHVEGIQGQQNMLLSYADKNEALLNNLIPLLAALGILRSNCEIFSQSVAFLKSPSERDIAKILIYNYGSHAVKFCETCSDIFEKAGILPSK
jgi:hypothetical protein